MIGIARRRINIGTKESFSAKMLDILYADTNGNLSVNSSVLPVSAGKVPIGICIAPAGFFSDNEPARFMSLKYMNYTTPETGSTTNQPMYWGNYGTDISTIDNITTTHNGGANSGYYNVEWGKKKNNVLPSLIVNDEWNLSALGAVNQYAVTDIDGKNKTDLILATATSQSTWQTDTSITNNSNAGYAPAACCCARYHTVGTEAGDWYLGAAGEMSMIIEYKTAINTKLAQIAAVYASDSISSLVNSGHWSSTEYSSNYAYFVSTINGYVYYGNKFNNFNVLAMLTF